MITWFHFVRLHDPTQAAAIAAELRQRLGPSAVVGVPADAHAAAGWCLCVHVAGATVEALAAHHERVMACLGDRAKVVKHWAFDTSTP